MRNPTTTARPSPRLLLFVVATVAVATCMSLLGATRAAAGDPVDVTVDILRFIQVQNPDPGPFQGCCGDYYAEVRIGAFASQKSGEIDDQADISPYWRFTRTVDSSLGSVAVNIKIWDADSSVAAPDDIMDLNPVDGVQDLTLVYNLQTGEWTGDTPTNVGFSQGDGDHAQFGLFEGGEAGKVFFDISTGNGDIDGDGIPDSVERFGVRDSNGNVVADLAAMGADPCRKTVLLEIDWMQGAADGHTHRPKDAAVAEAKAAFAAAPLPPVAGCPYPGFPSTAGDGVQLLVDVSNGIPEQPVLGLGSDFEAVRDANFNPARRPYFHYVVFVHDQAAGSSSSGLCCSAMRDLIVSLGSWRTLCVNAGANGTLDTAPAGDDVVQGNGITVGADRTCNTAATGDDGQSVAVGGGAADAEVGTVRDQSGSILHELGHSLALGHGGDSGINYKPNYLSVMNYAFDPGGIPDASIGANRLDYSRSALPALDETALSEPAGIGDGQQQTTWLDASGATRWGAGNAGLDWDGSGSVAGTVGVDLNGDAVCVSAGGNGTLDTTPAGDDAVVRGAVRDGADRTCNTTAAGDDKQERAVGNVQPNPLTGYDDWANITFRGVLAVNAGGADGGHGPDITFQEAYANQQVQAAYLDPDLSVTVAASRATVSPGESLTYTATVRNHGTGPATSVSLANTLPGSAATTTPLPDLAPGASTTRTFTYTVPCDTVDGASLVDTATVSGKNAINVAESHPADNTATATSTATAPVLTIDKTVTTPVPAGEVSTTSITYTNTGSGTAATTTVTDVLPAGVYYSTALDAGAGPQPDGVSRNGDGTTTLTWSGDALAAGATRTVEITTRSTLLAVAGTTFTDTADVTWSSSGGCVYAPVTTTATTATVEVTPTRNPLSQGYWSRHTADWTAEVRARVQATDQRFDTGADGALDITEVDATFAGTGQPSILGEQLLAAFANLATRRVNASTVIASRMGTRLGIGTVGAAARYAMETLAIPLGPPTASRYSDATTLLDEINTGRSERY